MSNKTFTDDETGKKYQVTTACWEKGLNREYHIKLIQSVEEKQMSNKTLERLAIGTPFEGLFNGNNIKPATSIQAVEEKTYKTVITVDRTERGNFNYVNTLELTADQAEALAAAIEALVATVQSDMHNDVIDKAYPQVVSKITQARKAFQSTSGEK